jgi:hypothetical protein
MDTGHGGGDEKKCREASTDAKKPLKGVLTGSCGGILREWLGTEEKERCVMGRDVKELMEGGPMGGHGGMCSERLATGEEKHGVGRRLETDRAGEDLPTVVKTNLPMPWAIGTRLVIIALILLHFCGGAQALHLPIRGLPRRGTPSDSLPGAGHGLAVAWGCAFSSSTGAGCGLAEALGCDSLGRTAAPLRAVEDKHNYTSLLTGGEMLQQHAWIPQRALLQDGKGQDSSALLRALGGAIMSTRPQPLTLDLQASYPAAW